MTEQKNSAVMLQYDDAGRQNQPGKDVSGILIVPHIAPQINPREARKRLIFGLFRGTGIALLIIGGWLAARILCATLDVWGVLLVMLGLWVMICLIDKEDNK